MVLSALNLLLIFMQNNMITEDYVSFETAKLLRKKGFEVNCYTHYSSDGQNVYYNYQTPSDGINMPTLQMAMKWLRREHGLHCSVDYDYVLEWYCQITNLKETVAYDYDEMKRYHPEKDNGFTSSEEACEAAIRYCLENLI